MKINTSIIISNYNYGAYVLDALASAINQTVPCHVVIVDDGSSDGSWDKIADFLTTYELLSHDMLSCNEPYYRGLMQVLKYENVTAIKINNSGASTARNVGMWEVWENTDAFAILDSDDIYHPTKVERLLAKLFEFDGIGVVYADYNLVRSGYTKKEFKQPYSPNRLLKECIVHSGALIKTKYLSRVLLPNQEIYDSNLHGPSSKGFIGCTEDYDLWLRLSKICMICHVPTILSNVRETGLNQSLKMTNETFLQNMSIISQR